MSLNNLTMGKGVQKASQLLFMYVVYVYIFLNIVFVFTLTAVVS